jgi:putative transposase
VAQQGRNVPLHFTGRPAQPEILIRDNNRKYSPAFDEVLKSEGMDVQAVAPASPDLNAHAECWVQSIKHEWLDHFLVVGEAHLRHLVRGYVDYYNGVRPHQALDNLPPTGVTGPPSTEASSANILCVERLGGLLKHYYRRAG